MPAISESVTINADIDTIFDLISRVEEFPLVGYDSRPEGGA